MTKLFYSIFVFLIFLQARVMAEPFISIDLSQSLKNLYEYNPKLKYERELLMSKDELFPQALSEFRPEVSGYYEKGKVDTNSAGFNITSDGIRTESNKGLTITQRLFDGGSSLSNIQVAKNEILAQRFFLKNIEQEVFLESIEIYADLATEKINQNLKKKNVEFLESQEELTKEQFEIGEVTLTDVSIAEARLSLAKSELLESSNKIISLSAKFESFFGMKPIKPDINMSLNLIDEKFEALKIKSKKNNPKILHLSYQIKSTEKDIQRLKRKRLPSLKLEAEAKINEGYFRTDSEREVLSAFAKVDIPLYQAGAASSKIRETKKKLFAQKELLKMENQEVEYNVVSSKSSLDYSISRINAYKKQIESNKIYLDGLSQELQLGERTTLDLLDGEQELLESELDLVKAYRDYFISYYRLLFFLGNLNARDLNLDVKLFDETKNFKNIKGKWLDIIE